MLASRRSSIVWSPLSNLLLYGGTARVEAAKAAGVTIGLGSDWSPSGSKNLLGELKVAWLYNQQSWRPVQDARARRDGDPKRRADPEVEHAAGTFAAASAPTCWSSTAHGGRPVRGADPRARRTSAS